MSNIVWHNASVLHQDRVKQKGHKSVVLWYTGLSGSGKSTIANAVDRMLYEKGCHTYLLDGDNIRHGLSKDLGFDEPDRVENIRRIAEVAKLFADAGLIVGTAFISPFVSEREQARELIGRDQFIEIFIDTDLSECEKRDPKGLYKKVRKGNITNFTGVSSPYEKPTNPEIYVKTQETSIKECAQKIIDYLVTRGII
ncbi:adenylylsulfate kinase [Allofrancisella inopinata]|uniref:Adenylyl-sulfate kinase n=1 Tax=Allofrancisella inopinata TaxID=1085647 RepID=A0AAE6YHC6_9GAMM|nr:adenylyl-sulfate kinase [Allofrancisella inopinata]QIV95576.1 adenylyl-sulfate kinase [Allofrancisella inopinata]TDT70735.1 adenylylsulfate kinase [Allofrancisella inopinata]